jgi:hypothetical protein
MNWATILSEVAGSEADVATAPVADSRCRADPPQKRGWRDRIWSAVVGFMDPFLRRRRGVHEFTHDPSCLLRIAAAEAPRELALADGTRIRTGDPVIMLHLWNEHLPRYFAHGADFPWALQIRRRMLASLHALARHLMADPSLQRVPAIGARVSLGRRRPRWQFCHVAMRFGFELIEVDAPPALRQLGDAIVLWSLARAFNPAALRRHCFRRVRAEVWISRAALLDRYGPVGIQTQTGSDLAGGTSDPP